MPDIAVALKAGRKESPRLRRAAASILAAIALSSVSAPAAAQDGFALDQFQPAPAGDRFFVLQGAEAEALCSG